MRDIDISVLITSMEGRSLWLSEALESVARQTRLPDEVVIVLEGNDPGWPAVLRAYEHLNLRVVQRLEVSGRPGPGKNRALREARGAFLVLLDDDDIALPHRIEMTVSFLETHPEYAWVCGRVEKFQGHTLLDIWPDPEKQPPGPVDLSRLFRGNVASYSAMTLRRETARLLGAFREDLPLVEDYEGWIRLASEGVKGYLLDAVVGRVRVHASNTSRVESLMRWYEIQVLKPYRRLLPLDEARRCMRTYWEAYALALEKEKQRRKSGYAWWRAGWEARKIRYILRAFHRWIFG